MIIAKVKIMKDKKYIFLTTAILWIVVFGCFFILLKKMKKVC